MTDTETLSVLRPFADDEELFILRDQQGRSVRVTLGRRFDYSEDGKTVVVPVSEIISRHPSGDKP